MFTQTQANCPGTRRGEEVSRLRVCLLQLPAQRKKKRRIRFQPSTAAQSRSKHGKESEPTSFAVKREKSESQIAGKTKNPDAFLGASLCRSGGRKTAK